MIAKMMMATASPSCPKGEERDRQPDIARVGEDTGCEIGAQAEPASAQSDPQHQADSGIGHDACQRNVADRCRVDLDLHKHREDQTWQRECHRQPGDEFQVEVHLQAGPDIAGRRQKKNRSGNLKDLEEHVSPSRKNSLCAAMWTLC